MKIVTPDQCTLAGVNLFPNVVEFLSRHEATNSIQLSRLWGACQFKPEVRTIIVLDEDHHVAGLATQEGTFPLLLPAGMSAKATEAIARRLVEKTVELPGIMGPTATVKWVAEYWAYQTGGTIKPGMAQRLLMASSVIEPTGIEGSWRPFTDDDRPLLREWFTWFALDAEHARPEQARRAGEAMVARLVSPDGGLIWEDAHGEPVSIACYKARTPNGIRIGPVFTPEKFRRHGYAAAVTAAATRFVLDQGSKFACLYTDSANPTSNHIYESIGYRFVSASMQYRFIWSTHDDDLLD